MSPVHTVVCQALNAKTRLKSLYHYFPLLVSTDMFENIWRWLHFMFWGEIKWTSAMCRVSLPLKLHAGEPNYDFTQHSNGFMASGLKGGKLAQSVNNEPAQCFLFVFVPHPTGARNSSTFSGEPLERTHSGWGGGESKKPGGHDAREKRPWHVRQYLIWSAPCFLLQINFLLFGVGCLFSTAFKTTCITI